MANFQFLKQHIVPRTQTSDTASLSRPSSAASSSETDGEEGSAASEVARRPKKAKRGATKVDEALMRYLSKPSASEVISKKLDDAFKQQQPSDERVALGHWLMARMTKVPEERWEDFRETVQALMRKFTKQEMPPPPTPPVQPQQPTVGTSMVMPPSPRVPWPQTHSNPLMWSQQQQLQPQQQWGWQEAIPTRPYQPTQQQATPPQPPRLHSTPIMHLQGQSTPVAEGRPDHSFSNIGLSDSLIHTLEVVPNLASTEGGEEDTDSD